MVKGEGSRGLRFRSSSRECPVGEVKEGRRDRDVTNKETSTYCIISHFYFLGSTTGKVQVESCQAIELVKEYTYAPIVTRGTLYA